MVLFCTNNKRRSRASREGLYALPKTMFDKFLNAVGLFFIG